MDQDRINEILRHNFPPPGSPPADNLFNGGVYLRGGLTLHALRVAVGDETFFRILQTYGERYKYSNASTADFIGVAEEISGQDLGDFFDGWLYAKQVPAIPEMNLSPAG
jgi:aminopeptidase N